MKVFKYAINCEGTTRVEMPEGAKILSAQLQHGEPFIWVLVDEDVPVQDRRFTMFMTGENIEDIENLVFIATLQFSHGTFVLHLFEII